MFPSDFPVFLAQIYFFWVYFKCGFYLKLFHKLFFFVCVGTFKGFRFSGICWKHQGFIMVWVSWYAFALPALGGSRLVGGWSTSWPSQIFDNKSRLWLPWAQAHISLSLAPSPGRRINPTKTPTYQSLHACDVALKRP